VHNHQLSDYDDVAAARAGLLQLGGRLTRDEQAVAAQRRALAEKYGLQTMVSNLLRIYARFGIEPLPDSDRQDPSFA
jgi:hypothetical protein